MPNISWFKYLNYSASPGLCLASQSLSDLAVSSRNTCPKNNRQAKSPFHFSEWHIVTLWHMWAWQNTDFWLGCLESTSQLLKSRGIPFAVSLTWNTVPSSMFASAQQTFFLKTLLPTDCGRTLLWQDNNNVDLNQLFFPNNSRNY